MKYQKKMAFVDAVQWTGDNYEEIEELTGTTYLYNNCLFVKAYQRGQISVNRGEYVVVSDNKVVVWKKEAFEAEFEPCALKEEKK